MVGVYKSVQYRYLNREACGLGEDSADTTLMSMIREAMRQTATTGTEVEQAKARIVDLDQDGKQTLLNIFNGNAPHERMFAGELVVYRQGIDIPVIVEELNENRKYFEETEVSTNDNTKKPIVGDLYFVVAGDHIGLISSQAVRGRWLERYLTCLFKNISNIIDGNYCVELNANIDLENLPPIQKIEICTSSNSSNSPEESRSAFQKICSALKDFGLSEEELAPSLDRAVSNGTGLEGSLSICIKRGQKSIDFPEDILDHALRNIESEDLVLTGHNGKFSNGLFRLAKTVKIQKGKTRLIPEDAIRQIVDQMREWARQGKIDFPM